MEAVDRGLDHRSLQSADNVGEFVCKSRLARTVDTVDRDPDDVLRRQPNKVPRHNVENLLPLGQTKLHN
jgi:hypothetical protein